MIDRNIRRSVLLRVRTLLEAPPAATGWGAFTVYDERQLRAVVSGALAAVRPCAFLTDSYIRPTPATLPHVSVEVYRTQRRPFELGNVNGRRADVRVHVFGRVRGERDDLGSFIADYLGPAIPIYDFPATGGTPTLIEQGLVRDQIELENIESIDSVRQEGSLDLWQIVTLSIETKQ